MCAPLVLRGKPGNEASKTLPSFKNLTFDLPQSKPAKSESNEPDGTEMESASRSSQLSSGSSSPSSSMAAERESDKNTVKGRQYVYRELVSTEQDYIRDLKIVVDVS